MGNVHHQIEGGETALGLHLEEILLQELCESKSDEEQSSCDLDTPPDEYDEEIYQAEDLAPDDDSSSDMPQIAMSRAADHHSLHLEGGLAAALLEHYPLSSSDAARLALEILESSHGVEMSDPRAVMNHCRHVLKLGIEAYAREQRTLPFAQVIDALILSKAHRRKRTIAEIKQYGERIMRNCPAWRIRPLSSITADDCQQVIMETFSSPSMQRKAYVILHGVFNFGMRRGWCACNPIALLDVPRPNEKRIRTLTTREIARLLRTALLPEHRACAPALGFMLWAGIRPTEVERITWADVHLRDKVIEICPQHSKTGGRRQVTIYPALLHWLRRVCTYTIPSAAVIPRSWDRKWRDLRRKAGFAEWQADILRHTFASYHLKHFRDLSALQIDMGHASSCLLRTRYIALDGITSRMARDFWSILPQIEATAQGADEPDS